MADMENRIFVNNLPLNATRELVADHFAQFGQIEDVYVPLIFGTQRHKGIAYVTFATAESRDAAIDSVDQHQILGQPIGVQVCIAKGKGKGGKAPLPGSSGSTENRVFVQGIGGNVTMDGVQEHFAQFGTWTDIYMPKGSFPAGHKGMCFITFTSADAVQQVLSSGPHIIQGQAVNVDLAVARDGKSFGKGACLGSFGVSGGFSPHRCSGCGSGCSNSFAGGFPNCVASGVQPQDMVQPAACNMQAASNWFSLPHHPMQMAMHHQPFNLQQAQQIQQQMQQQIFQQVLPHHQLQGPIVPNATAGRSPMLCAGRVLPGRLFLTKMSPNITKDELTKYFSQFGTLNDVYIPPGGKLIAFIGYDDPAIAVAVAQMQTHEVKPGHSVCVDAAVERPAQEGKGSSKHRFFPY